MDLFKEIRLKRNDAKLIKFLVIVFILSLECTNLSAQNEGKQPVVVSGLWLNNLNFAIVDAKIGASNTPFYEDKKWGGESWLNLSALYKNWKMEVRLDGFQNSILLNPEDVYSDFGLGYVNLRYSGQNFSSEIGHFYEQIGNGLIMRSYKDLPLLIDNAIFGAKLQFYLPGNQSIMVYGGKPKDLFSLSDMYSVGGEYRLDWAIKSVYLSSGFGSSIKILESDIVDHLISEVELYLPQDSVGLYKSSQLYSIFNDLSYGPFSWSAEYAVKYHDTYFNSESKRNLWTGGHVFGKFETALGQALYSSMSLDYDHWSFQLEGKYVDKFSNKSDPFSFNYRNDLHFIPPMAQVQTYRLKSRYIPATQFLGEQSAQINIGYAGEHDLFSWNNTLIYSLADVKLYEAYDLNWERSYSAGKYIIGIMKQQYNQDVYEGKPGAPQVKTWIPYAEYYREWEQNKSLKIEGQALFTDEDKGNLYYMGMEYNSSEKWSWVLAAMYEAEKDNIYPTLGVYHKRRTGIYSLSFVKQVEGIVCSGGICRFEPAFSGIKITTQTRF
ncbi:DUF6029 family protein [Membranihabitans marinus]|uniref:DUF6029 family protein n=1 Tax=Membranihabitans marinus TaxID=1227546 RepID=UPI001F3B0005|nr:DUF6029 family protein [Membranihabitans marinus]